MRNIWKIKFYVLLIVGISACGSSQNLSSFDLAPEYDLNSFHLPFSANFEYVNDSINELQITLNTDHLLYTKNPELEYIARYSISYKVFTSYSSPSPIDSATIHYSEKDKPEKNNIKTQRLKLFAPIGSNYIVMLTVLDENRNHKSSKFFVLQKKNPKSRDHFLIQSLQNGVKGQYQSDSFSINSLLKKELSVKVHVIRQENLIAPKPHEVNYNFQFQGEADSSFVLRIPSEGRIILPPLKNGFYHIQTDTILKDGFSVFMQSNSFPKITDLSQAIRSMGYLLDGKDYADLLSRKNPRDYFEWQWIKLAGGKERARKLMKEYYQIIETTNDLFTSYKPGWATDRGMIYIIYGPPKIVYRNDKMEIWTYGEENNLLNEVFQFRKINSPIADNIYELDRNINYKIGWNRRIAYWKEESGY